MRSGGAWCCGPTSAPIIIFSGVDWQFLRHRHHHLALGFATRTRVLFIEPACTWWWWCRTLVTRPRQALRRLRGLRTLGPRIIIFSPFLFPFQRLFPRLYALNVRWLQSRLAQLVGRLGFRGSVLWITTPLGRPYIGHLDERIVCFDCLDDYASFEYPYLRREMEGVDELARRADFVVATARGLYDQCRRTNPHTYLLPNAADVDHFSAPAGSPPLDIANIPRPIVGYVGSVFEWIDLELLEVLARTHPEWSFVLVGPERHADTSRLSRLGNGYALGERPYGLIPQYVHSFDVCLVPFKITPVTERTNPVKVFEYLAAGRPVVATRLPELESFRPHVRLALGADEFAQQIRRALAEQGEEEREARRRFAAANTWDDRVESAMAIIDRELARLDGRALVSAEVKKSGVR
ncbi:hypothetical protein AMJ82_04305 [candidate division TA06 bacterium SM23_40]|uniref:Spore protein YkvP/CgeB glycosyl transferase-like domain-containing protein n=1 Tax=candidate division TA06 bacterium SM23_40 TaxID=1703774 RepID=A0A0S8G9T5_UNCT6|nr:MAG: hypothetical protein AMJ82_04305 [candidate division TA06 bacterium SM23_40]